MTSLWMVARRLAGTTRGSTILFVALVALISGFVQFGVAAARRTDSSFDRFVEWSQPATLSTGGINDDSPIPIGDRLPPINSLPDVEDWARIEAVSSGWIELTPGVHTQAPRLNTMAIGSEPNNPEHGRMKVLEGRIPAATSDHEVITDYPTADAFGLEVGDQFTIVMSQHVDDGEPRIDTPWPVRLVGIVSVPGTFPTIAGYSFPTLLFPPGFRERHPEWIDPYAAGEQLWLKGGTSDADHFASELQAMGLGGLDIQVDAVNYAGAEKVVRLQASGLWLAAGIAAMTGLVVIAQLLMRQRGRVARELHIGTALGMNRRQAVIGTAINDGMRAVAGAVLGAAVAIAASPLSPFGLARKAEPNPGLRIDSPVLVIGIAATVVAVIGVGALCTVTLLRKQSIMSDADTQAPSRSRVGGTLVEPLASGWRMAFASRRAVVFSLTPIVLTVVALVVVATGVHNVVALPHHTELSGGSWDAFITNEEEPDVTERLLDTTPEVAAWAHGGWSDVMVEGTDVFVQALEPGTGVLPSITQGRAPVRDNEIALGSKVLEQLHKRVGDSVVVDVGDEGGETATFDIVGEAIIASPLFRSLQPDQGGLITDHADERWFNEGRDAYLVSFHDGVTPTQGFDAVYAGYPDNGPFGFTRTARGDVVALDSMVVVPWMLVVFLGALTIASLAQWSIVASRRERHRAAVLRALGLTGGQVTLAFMFAALLVTATSALVGTTVGVAAGRALWRVAAGWLTVVPQPSMPWRLCTAALATMMLSALALAAISSRRHAGSPGRQLRVE